METEAPRNSAPMSGAGQGSVVSSWSCFNCRRRKARCNRQSPCAFCSKAGVECSYPFTGRMPTRQHNPAAASLLDRLRQLENVVDEMKAQEKNGTSRHIESGDAIAEEGESIPRAGADSAASGSNTTDSCSDLSHKLSKSFGSLHVCGGGTLYTSNGFCAALHDELRSVRHAFEASDVDDLNGLECNPSVHDDRPDSIPFPFAQNCSPDSILHPAPSLIPFLWKTYVENVDPFIKILHVPSMDNVIQQTKDNLDELSPGMRALLFSISLAAVVSMSDADVEKEFGNAKEDVLAHFVMGTETALSEAGILKSTDLCVAQASLIYLESAGHRYGMRTVWMMSGILVRAAMSVGLHRDGVAFPKMSCFQAEMRRRLWWHIYCFDARVSQCYAPEIMITNSMLDTKEPTNCNDADLDVNMEKDPVAREGFTDVSFTLMACELRRLYSHVLSLMSALLDTGERQQAAQHNALHRIEKARHWAKTTVLGDSERRRPIQPFMDFLFNMLLDQLRIIVRDTNIFKRWASTDDTNSREQSFFSALALLGDLRQWRNQYSTRHWGWILVNFQDWHPLGIALIHLQTQKWDPACEEAWTLAVQTLNAIPPAMMTQNPLRQSIVNLVTATRQHRERQIEEQRCQAEAPSSISKTSECSIPISSLADIWTSCVNEYPAPITEGLAAQRPATETAVTTIIHTATSNAIKDNTFEEVMNAEQLRSDACYPPWCFEMAGGMNSEEDHFQSLECVGLYNLFNHRG
ncbi:hypothetical protein M419DRAFT_77049 [Trichoderma reesei RUT C-30]|uniref:Zn(2)-C6 fungal-type domain-containing protein n=1 Tax=Hypocrea jecorina (strain ATCC 56765 / BCRC 32924 / NRRL 11460 / Rut C-30) TaxID=1344414 RepID=A0A024SES9_HYPJR|nr:hypothetical protein M419DRAFT_77049 [Trichoderma reesei RUT C-30]